MCNAVRGGLCTKPHDAYPKTSRISAGKRRGMVSRVVQIVYFGATYSQLTAMNRFLIGILLAWVFTVGACQCSDKPDAAPVAAATR